MLTIFALVVSLCLLVGSAAPALAQTKKKTSKKTTKKKVPPKPKVKVNPALVPMVGTWFTVDSQGKFAKSNKFVFTGDGAFQYFGPGWSSSGTFSLASAKVLVKDEAGNVVEPEKTITNLKLTWLKVDGAKVAKPFSKTMSLSEDKKRFQIERFTYGKS